MAYLTGEQLSGEWVERPFTDVDRSVLGNAAYGAKFWRYVAGQEWHLWVRPDGFVSIDQAARLLEVSSQLIDRWWARGEVTHHASPAGHRMLALSQVRNIHRDRLRQGQPPRQAR
jgi:hypothetical protein